MTSLDRPVWAPLLDFRQNQARFRGFPCASADNADSRPTAAAGDRSRCPPPGAEGTARPPGPAGHSGHPLLATLAWATSEADHTRGGGLSGR